MLTDDGEQSSTARGREAEQRACIFLQERGLRLIERNYRTPLGEIDLIMADKDILVFIEVRSRASCRFGDPLETVNRHKQNRLVKTAARYLQQHRQWATRRCRFDVVSLTPDSAPHWVPNAFTGYR